LTGYVPFGSQPYRIQETVFGQTYTSWANIILATPPQSGDGLLLSQPVALPYGVNGELNKGVKAPGPGNGTPQQPQRFWQKPGCESALVELGAGTVGTALTAGALVASAYLGREMYEGFEGVVTLVHVGPVGVPGVILMGKGA